MTLIDAFTNIYWATMILFPQGIQMKSITDVTVGN